MNLQYAIIFIHLFFGSNNFSHKVEKATCLENKHDYFLMVMTDTIPKYEYWIDQNYVAKTTVLNDSTSIFTLIDTIDYDTLSHGLHTFNIRFKPDGKKWSSVSTSYFYKPKEVPTGTSQYEYWLDQNYSNKISISLAPSSNMILLDSINYDTLSYGLHTFNIRFRPDGKTWSSVSPSFFYKLHTCFIGQPKYQYWFDNNIQDSTTINNVSAIDFILLDSINSLSLSEGLHTFNIRFKPTGGQWSDVNSSFFVRGKTNIGTEISKCVYWFDDDYNNHYTIYYNGTANIFDFILAATTGLNNGEHNYSMFFMDNAGYWSSIVKDTFVKDTILPIQCPNNQIFASGLGNEYNLAYQWQVNEGTGYVNLSNSAIYSGVTTDTLTITSPPTLWYGNTYRCIVTLPNNSNMNGVTYLLKFIYMWTGASDTNWENPLNWNCNGVPAQNADVFINSGTVIINSNVDVGSLTTRQGAAVELQNGMNLSLRRW